VQPPEPLWLGPHKDTLKGQLVPTAKRLMDNALQRA
jgi:hypothetical protein